MTEKRKCDCWLGNDSCYCEKDPETVIDQWLIDAIKEPNSPKTIESIIHVINQTMMTGHVSWFKKLSVQGLSDRVSQLKQLNTVFNWKNLNEFVVFAATRHKNAISEDLKVLMENSFNVGHGKFQDDLKQNVLNKPDESFYYGGYNFYVYEVSDLNNTLVVPVTPELNASRCLVI